MAGVREHGGQEFAEGGLGRHGGELAPARLRLASLARKSSRCLARPLAFLRALSASALALAGRGVAERAADLGCSAVDPTAEGSRREGR